MISPLNSLKDIGPQAQKMAKECRNERMELTLQCVAIGSMIVMAAATAVHLVRDLFGRPDHHGRSK